MSPIPSPPSAVDKLRTALPEIAGKTIHRTVVFWRGERWQVFLIFTDGTDYELYGRGDMNGARGVRSTIPDADIADWAARQGGDWSVVAPEP